MVENTTTPLNIADLQARAAMLESEGRFAEAGEALDEALKLDPSAQSCAEARARVALQMAEEDAVDHCARALAFHAAYPDRQLRMIDTAAAALGVAAIPLLESYIRDNPQSTAAHERLSELRAEAGAGESFADSYREALELAPENKALLMSWWDTLSRSGRLMETLESMDAHRQRWGTDPAFLLLEANIAIHAGQTERAGHLLDQLDDHPDAQIARGQHLLQTGCPQEAGRLLETVTVAQPSNQTAWALLELAWRLADDCRHEWLAGQANLYGAVELDLGAGQLSDIAAHLRTLHRARSQPVGQSVRGGTQTPGQLFLRSDPEILLLIGALVGGIRQFHAGLPAVDRRHPLLRHRDHDVSFGASWSVRLTEGGFHASHFHPGGILSSACYVSLPEGIGDDPDRQGWLEIGRPPPELKLDLGPLAAFEPRPGRLILFPSYLFHGTRPFRGGERLTVAFDLVASPV